MKHPEFVDFLKELAAISGEVIKPYFFNRNLEVESKADETPVTRADKEAESVMREIINKLYPNHGIIGEEYGEENEDAEFVWTLDPIDGTISFATGVPLFGTIVSVLKDKKPILGMIYQPVLDLLCIGDGIEATLNGQSVTLRETANLSEAVLLSTDIQNIAAYQNRPQFDALVERTKVFRTWGDCYGYLLLASGWADIMIDPIVNPWDKFPLIPIIQGAGGVISDWQGNDASDADSIVAAHPKLHSEILEILNRK